MPCHAILCHLFQSNFPPKRYNWISKIYLWSSMDQWVNNPWTILNTIYVINTLRPRQKKTRHFTDEIFKFIWVNENVRMSVKISLMFVPSGSIDNRPLLAQFTDTHLHSISMINTHTHARDWHRARDHCIPNCAPTRFFVLLFNWFNLHLFYLFYASLHGSLWN